jgi:hypothetical protein
MRMHPSCWALASIAALSLFACGDDERPPPADSTAASTLEVNIQITGGGKLSR